MEFVSIDKIITALRRRIAIDDSVFDRLYPEHVRRLSQLHWTPVSVAVRAAALLAPEPGMRVLDLGAGPGKLCCIGALAHDGTWQGLERDPSLVATATATARALQIEHATSFSVGDLAQVDWNGFESLYLYNPFEALLFGGGSTGPQGGAVFADQVARVEQRLSELVVGTRVVTFHGFGGNMPPCFARVATERGDGELALWIKQPRSRPRQTLRLRGRM